MIRWRGSWAPFAAALLHPLLPRCGASVVSPRRDSHCRPASRPRCGQSCGCRPPQPQLAPPLRTRRPCFRSTDPPRRPPSATAANVPLQPHALRPPPPVPHRSPATRGRASRRERRRAHSRHKQQPQQRSRQRRHRLQLLPLPRPPLLPPLLLLLGRPPASLPLPHPPPLQPRSPLPSGAAPSPPHGRMPRCTHADGEHAGPSRC